MTPEIWKALVTILFGAIAGGLTNTIAIWMLFHPYEPPKLFGRWRIGLVDPHGLGERIDEESAFYRHGSC